MEAQITEAAFTQKGRSNQLIARPDQLQIGVSKGFAAWLNEGGASLAVSSFQSGRLFLVGLTPEGRVSLHQQAFTRVMGLAWTSGRLFLSSHNQIWELENQAEPGELAAEQYDVQLVPRRAHVTGAIDVHEMAVDGQGRLIVVATDLSCLGALDSDKAFWPVWKPPFISAIERGDRCHMNGLAMAEGQPKLVTCVSQTDFANGWHGRPLPRGVIVDTRADRIVTDELAMPHSPRLWGKQILVLDSGTGFLTRIDPSTGALERLVFLPGFARGLEIIGNHAVITVSKPRHDNSFEGLPIAQDMTVRELSPMCALMIVDLEKSEIVEWLAFGGSIKELFTVISMPGVRCPSSLGPHAEDFNQEFRIVTRIEPLTY